MGISGSVNLKLWKNNIGNRQLNSIFLPVVLFCFFFLCIYHLHSAISFWFAFIFCVYNLTVRFVIPSQDTLALAPKSNWSFSVYGANLTCLHHWKLCCPLQMMSHNLQSSIVVKSNHLLKFIASDVCDISCKCWSWLSSVSFTFYFFLEEIKSY